jgi:hypothetical protein
MRLFRPDLGQDLSGNVIKPSLVVSFRGTPKSSKSHGIYMGIMSNILIIYSNIPKSFLVLDHDLVTWNPVRTWRSPFEEPEMRKKQPSGNIESHMLPVWPGNFLKKMHQNASKCHAKCQQKSPNMTHGQIYQIYHAKGFSRSGSAIVCPPSSVSLSDLSACLSLLLYLSL